MRVALLTNFVPPYRLALYRELATRCSSFEIFVSAKTEAGRRWQVDWDGLPVRLQRTITLPGTWRHPNSFSEQIHIHVPYDTIARLIRFRPDVILSGEFGMRTLQAALYRGLFPNSKLVVWALLSDITEQGRGRLRHYLRAVLLRVAAAVVVNGEGGVRYIRGFGIHRDRIFPALQTTDLQPFLGCPVSRPAGSRHRLLYCGTFTERKGILPFLGHLAEWAATNPEQEIECGLLGHGPLRAGIESFQRPSNLQLKVFGPVPYDRLPDIYREYGILAFPTLADEWGMVVTEAMASGVPVLGSVYSQAVEELVTDNYNGWTFRPDRPAEIHNALDRSLRLSVPRLNEMAANARSAVCALTPGEIADRIMAAVRYANEETTCRP
jgi:glycosyltransferase involved in cell wall biosynthesis